MKKLITIAVCSALASPLWAQSDRQKQAYNKDSDYAPSSQSAYSRDASGGLEREPCPDKFDTDWRRTNTNHPCLKAYERDGEMPEYVMVEKKPAESTSTTSQSAADKQRSESDEKQTSGTATAMSRDSSQADDKVCSAEDRSEQALTQSRYESVLANTDPAVSGAIPDDFDPSMETAKSVDQLEDDDLREEHYIATFNALDDNNSGTVDKGEALGVRGLADAFSEVDFNQDGVLTPAEFEMHFAGTVYTGNGLCVDGERVTSADQLGENYNAGL